MSRRLAIVLSTSPDSGDFERARVLAAAARNIGVEVGLFFMDAGVETLATSPDDAAELAALGCDVWACSQSAEQRNLTERHLPGVVLGSQDDHAALVHAADRVLAFA